MRILLVGASGRMGRSVCTAVASDAGITLVGRYASAAHPDQGIAALDTVDAADEFDVAIDFSRPAGLLRCLALCERRQRPLVTGTTGLDAALQDRLATAAAVIPLVAAANFSVGMAVLEALVAQAAQALPDWDCDIVEVHHRDKRDAPSGTALALGTAVDGRRRSVQAMGRPVRYASLRCGDVVGEHTVQFSGSGERLELVHRASDRGVFARGALEAAKRLAGRPPGRYSLAGLLLG